MSDHPHPYVVLAIDPGKVSGWALFIEGDYITSGTARDYADRNNAARLGADAADTSKRPLVVVAEKWTPGGKFAGARTMAGLGAAWGLWLAALEVAEVPVSRVLRVHTQTWRAAVLGGGWGVTSREWDARAQRHARVVTGRDELDDNEADAIGIGAWAFTLGGRVECDRKLPKKLRRTA